MDGDAHNNVVQVVFEQVWQGFCHDLFLAHSLETVPFPLDLLEAIVYFLLLAVRLALLGLLGLGFRRGGRAGATTGAPRQQALEDADGGHGGQESPLHVGARQRLQVAPEEGQEPGQRGV